MSEPWAVIKAGSTHPEIAAEHGDFEDWIVAGLGLPDDRIRVIDAQRGEPLPPGPSAVVISGAAEMVTDREPWSEAVADWLAPLVADEVPVLGICYGHQLLAQALGGRVDWTPGGKEIGTGAVRTLEEGQRDDLLGILPEEVLVQTTHAQSVVELPEGAVRLAENEADPNHAFRIGERAWGIQFHPEFSAPVMRMYIERQRDELAARGVEVDELLARVTDSPAEALLRRFAELVGA